MRIKRVDPADADTIRACFEAFLPAQQADEPDGPWFTERPFRGWLTVGWGGDPREIWLAEGPAEGTVAGWYRLELPDLENLDQADLTLVVHPAQRRRGIGRALLKHAAARAAEHGRSVLNAPTRLGGDGEAFARAAGGEQGLVDVQRVMDVRATGDDQLARLRAAAEEKAAGYSLVSWTGLVPEEFIEQAAALFAALNDAPHDPHSAPAVWDARRVRERVNDLRPAYGLRIYAVAARHDATGELAGLTEVAVDPADPGWGHQMLTGVTQGAPRAPARPAGQGGHGGVAEGGGAAAGTAPDLERPIEPVHDRGQRGARLHHPRAAGQLVEAGRGGSVGPGRCRGGAGRAGSWPARTAASRGRPTARWWRSRRWSARGSCPGPARWPGRPAVRRRSAVRRPCRSGSHRPGTTPGPGR